MRERSELIRNGVKSGMTNLSDIRSDYKLKSDNARVVIPEYKVNKVEPIKLTEEQQFNMKHFGQLTAPQNRQYIGRPTNESRQSRDIARDNVVNRERLERFENERAADRERELKVVPYATMGAIGLATGTLPEMIAADLGGRAVDYGSEKLTGKS